MAHKLVDYLQAAFTNWRPRMIHTGVKSLYAFVASAALFPLAKAIQNGDSTILQELTVLLAGIGTNLLANMLQACKNEAELAHSIEALPIDAPVHNEISEVLQKINAISIARDSLPIDEVAWFDDLWTQHLDASGAIGIVVGRDNAGILNTGDQIQGNKNIIHTNGGLVVQGDVVADKFIGRDEVNTTTITTNSATTINNIQGRVVLIVVLVLLLIGLASLMTYWFWPKPLERSKFQVAIAQFSVVDSNGSSKTNSSLGQNVAEDLYKVLVPQSVNSNCTVESYVKTCYFPPSAVGMVSDENARSKIQELDVNILVYGVITQSVYGTSIQPKFVVSTSNLILGVEILGTYELGSVMEVRASEIVETLLAKRAKALSSVVFALAYMYQCRYEDAIGQLEKVLTDNDTLITESDGKPVIYFLLGSAQLSLAQTHPETEKVSQVQGSLSKALDAYSHASTISSTSIYPRAILGQYFVRFGQILAKKNSKDYVDGLTELEGSLRADFEIFSFHGNTRALQRAHYLLGEIYRARSLKKQEMVLTAKDLEIQREADEDIRRAESEFHIALKLLTDSQDESSFIARIYSDLGSIAQFADPNNARDYFEKAILYSPADDHDSIIEYYYSLGSLYRAQDNNEFAIDAFRKCVEIKPICVKDYFISCQNSLQRN